MLVEHQFSKLEAYSSDRIVTGIPLHFCGCSSTVEHLVAIQEVVGSSPISRSISFWQKHYFKVKTNTKNEIGVSHDTGKTHAVLRFETEVSLHSSLLGCGVTGNYTGL